MNYLNKFEWIFKIKYIFSSQIFNSNSDIYNIIFFAKLTDIYSNLQNLYSIYQYSIFSTLIS